MRFEIFDAQSGEVSLWVNWHLVRELGPTRDRSWSRKRTASLPDEWIRDGGRNYVHFVAAGDHPDWSQWGVRGVSLLPGP